MSYTVIRPGNHYPSRLPEFGDAPVVKLVTPRLAPSRIGEYLIALPAGGGTTRPVAPGFETFLYALEGGATLSGRDPAGRGRLRVPARGRVAWTRRGRRRAGAAPRRQAPLRAGRPATTPRRRATATARTCRGRRRRCPASAAASSSPSTTRRSTSRCRLLVFDPGVGLAVHRDPRRGARPLHDRRRRDYLLDGDEHEVAEGDFIYMPPYCPQGFAARAASGAEYLLYKDTWRDGF